MRYIAHRGNIDGPNPEKENHPDYIEEALSKGFDVEVDVRTVYGKYFLGHDKPMYALPKEFLENNRIWFHCKDHIALDKFNMGVLINKPHYFFHEEDSYAITSQGYIWVYPGKPLLTGSIYVLPERSGLNGTYDLCSGICSDFIGDYKI